MANLLTNGDFETTPIATASSPVGTVAAGGTGLPGWTISAGTIDVVNSAGWSSAGGATSIDLNGNDPGTISQSFPTTAGKVYKLTFSLAGNPAGITSKSLKVTFGTASQVYNFDITNTTTQNMQWVIKTQQFTATGTTAKLEFQSQTAGALGPALDSVIVEEAAEVPKLDYSIQDQYAEKGIYQLKTIPKYGKLLLNGVAMKVDDRFTQKDINTGAIKYDVGIVNTPLATVKDDFNFVVLSGGAPVTQDSPKRSACMPVPDLFIPKDGIYTFPITLLVTPPPTQQVNTGLTLYETQTKEIGKANLVWGNERSTAEQIVYTTTALPLAAVGVLYKNGTPVAVGDKFTQAELNAGGFSFTAAENVNSVVKWQFGICNQVDKCAAGDFTITVKAFPSPVITKSNMSINECAKDVEVTPSQLMATLDGNKDFPTGTDEVVYTFEGCVTEYDITPGVPGTPGTPAKPDRLAASVLKVRISGSILNGIMPKWRIEVDGVKVGDAEYTTVKLRSKEEFDEVTLQGAFGNNPNQVVIFYLNNDGATPDDVSSSYELDRNLYVDYIDLNGKKVYGKDVSLESPGSWPNAPKYGGVYTNSSLPFVTGGAPPATIPGEPAIPAIPEIPEIRTPRGSTLTVGRLTITPCSFTNKTRETTKVKISDNCTGQSSTDCINLPFTASWRNKSVPGKFRVCFIPKPVVTEPMPQDLTVVDACLYKTVPGNQTETANGFFPGVAQLLANCGEFVVIYGRDVPKDIPVGTIVYLPDAGPKTVMVVPKADGTTVLAAYPNTPTKPTVNGDFPVKDTAGSLPSKFESSDDGTKYIRDSKGQVVPLAGTAPEGGTKAPNIDGFAQAVPHVTDVATPSEAPKGQTKVMTPNGITLVEDKSQGFSAWFVEGDIDYGVFFWSGPNEFYVAPGQSFAISVFGPRGFVKITPQGSLDGEHFTQTSNGYTQYYAQQQGINWSGQGFLGVKSGQDGQYAWGGEAVSSKFMVKQGEFPVIFNRAYTNLDNYVQVGTNAGGVAYGGRPNFYPDPYSLGRNAYPPELDKSNVQAVGNVPYYVWWHLNGARSRLNGATSGEAKAYRHATLTPAERVRNKATGPGPLIDLTLPGAGTTWEFPLTALDLVTGQQLSRTYKVHWTATGRSPAGRSAETTDLMGLVQQGAGAVPGSLHCKVSYNGGRPEDNCAKK